LLKLHIDREGWLKIGYRFWVSLVENYSPSRIEEGWKKSLSAFPFVHADETALTLATQPG